MADFAVLNIPTAVGHLEPSHVANGFARSRQCVLDGFLKSSWRRANYFNLLVNVFCHARIVCRRYYEHNKNAQRLAGSVGPCRLDAVAWRPYRTSKLALQTHAASGSLGLCEDRSQYGY